MFGPNINIILKKRKTFAGGKLIFTEHKIRAIPVQREKTLDPDLFGIQNRNSFILPAEEVIAEPGDQIQCDLGMFEITGTRMCVDLSGKIRGIKCSVK